MTFLSGNCQIWKLLVLRSKMIIPQESSRGRIHMQPSLGTGKGTGEVNKIRLIND